MIKEQIVRLTITDNETKAEVVGEVVRCKDCIYGEQDEIGRWFCRNFGCQVGDDNGNGFCACGERKDGESDD